MEPLDYTLASRENCAEHRQHKRVKQTYSRRTNSQHLQATSTPQALQLLESVETVSKTAKNTSIELPQAKKRTIADFFGPASKTPTSTQSGPSSSSPIVHSIPFSSSRIPISPPSSSPLRGEPEKKRQRRRLHYKPQHIHELDDNMPSPEEIKDKFYKNVHEVAAQANAEARAEAEARAAAGVAAAESLKTERDILAGARLEENDANSIASNDSTLVDAPANVDIGPTCDTRVKRKSSQVNRYAEYKPNSSGTFGFTSNIADIRNAGSPFFATEEIERANQRQRGETMAHAPSGFWEKPSSSRRGTFPDSRFDNPNPRVNYVLIPGLVSIKDDHLSVDLTDFEPSSPPRYGTPGKELLTYGKRRKIAKDIFDGYTSTFFDTDSSSSSKRSLSRSSLGQVKKKGTPLVQSSLNIGQRTVFISCKDCDFKYNRTNRQDVEAHKSYHADLIQGVNLNYMNFSTGTKPVKRSVFTYSANDGLEHIGFIISFDASSDKKWRVKVETAIKKVERTLNIGSPLTPDNIWSKVTAPATLAVAYGDLDRRIPRFVVYCVLSDQNIIIALLVCERVTRATIIEYAPCTRDGHTAAEDGALGEEITEHKEVVQGETFRTFMGVHYIWTHESYRRLALATKLLDYARDGHFVKGYVFNESEIAWTNFTEAGQGLAGRYLTGDHVFGRSWETNIYNSEL